MAPNGGIERGAAALFRPVPVPVGAPVPVPVPPVPAPESVAPPVPDPVGLSTVPTLVVFEPAAVVVAADEVFVKMIPLLVVSATVSDEEAEMSVSVTLTLDDGMMVSVVVAPDESVEEREPVCAAGRIERCGSKANDESRVRTCYGRERGVRHRGSARLRNDTAVHECQGEEDELGVGEHGDSRI